MIKFLIYPFFAVQVAQEMVAERGISEIRQAMHSVLVETLADAKEINELKAELAVLRSELNEVKYQAGFNDKRVKAAAI